MKKKIIIGVLIAALIAGGTVGGAVYYRKSHQSEVSVVSVDSLASQYYTDDTSLEGNIATSARNTRRRLPIFLIRNICITFLILPRLSPRLSTIPGSAEKSPVRSPLPQPTSYPATGPCTSC